MTADNEAREQAKAQYRADNPHEGIDWDDFDAGWDGHAAALPAVPAATGELIAELRSITASQAVKGFMVEEDLEAITRAADALEVLLAQTAGGQQ